MIDISKLPADVLSNLHSRGLTDDEIDSFSSEQLFDEYCNWLGLLGYGPQLVTALDSLREAKS